MSINSVLIERRGKVTPGVKKVRISQMKHRFVADLTVKTGFKAFSRPVTPVIPPPSG
jgi:hypothetical protein